MVESRRLLERGGIRASTEKHSGRVPQKVRISVSTKKFWNLAEYREKVESVRVQKNCPDEYLKRVESMSVPKNGRIRVSIGKRWNLCEY